MNDMRLCPPMIWGEEGGKRLKLSVLHDGNLASCNIIGRLRYDMQEEQPHTGPRRTGLLIVFFPSALQNWCHWHGGI